jgi:protease IV
MASPATPAGSGDPKAMQTIVIQQHPPSSLRKWGVRLLLLALLISVIVNFTFYARYNEYFDGSEPPDERYVSGDKRAGDKIALLHMTGTVMPPFTGQIIRSIKRAREDDAVKGAILVVDSPGGLVADSQQIYHELKKLRAKKPIAVVMQRMAASGGYYIAMGAGPKATIYAEPTTWTGSIGVIIPRYNAHVLAVERLGVTSEPLKTGRFKDSLNPFRDLRDDEVELWTKILNDAFDRFLNVVADNRPKLARADSRLLGWNPAVALAMQKLFKQPPEKTVEYYATGQVFTAKQALQAGLVDRIGYLDDAIEDMKKSLKLERVRVVRYRHPLSLWSALLGSARAQQPQRQWAMWRNLAVPQPMYYCSSLPLIPAVESSDGE